MALALAAQLEAGLRLDHQAAPLPAVAGRVGNNPSRPPWFLVTRAGSSLHIRCLANPEFWLELDAETGLARGHLEMAGMRHSPGRHAFAVVTDGGVACVYHSACAAFWLEISVTTT